MRRVVDWTFTIPFLVAFGIVIAVFEPIARIARLFGLRALEWTMAVFQRILLWLLRIVGVRLRVDRSPLLAPRRGYVIVSNHQSMFDIPVFGGLLLSNFPKYVAKKELGRWIPTVSFNLTHGGNAIIDRDDRSQSLRAIRDLATSAQRRNVSVVIFPEGTRSRDGTLGDFKRAGLASLLRYAPDLPVVPTTIDGAWRLFRHRMFPMPFGVIIRVRFGDPIPRSPDDDPSELLARAHEEIAKTLHRWRSTASV